MNMQITLCLIIKYTIMEKITKHLETVLFVVKKILNYIRNFFTKKDSATAILVRYIKKHRLSFEQDEFINSLLRYPSAKEILLMQCDQHPTVK